MQLVIKNNLFSAGILPHCGGSLSFFKKGETDLLRPCSENETEANNSALFVMIPYCSFIKDNHFPYFGITRAVQKNTLFSSYALHGDIWRTQGEIVFQNENSVQLKFIHLKSKGFPFNYTAYITYQLTEEGLSISIKLENNSALPMPYGMGIHPFFNYDKATLIQYQASHLWYRDEDPIMGHPYTIPKNLNFETLHSIPNVSMDISVGGWDGSAQVQTNNFIVNIQADLTFRHLNLFVSRNKKFFCLEPITNTPDAFNLAALGVMGTGIQSLGPHETTEASVQLQVKGK